LLPLIAFVVVGSGLDQSPEPHSDISLPQKMRDYDAYARLSEAIQSGAYLLAICSVFKGAKQQGRILAKIPAQAAWSES
jgi:hypothetical protein